MAIIKVQTGLRLDEDIHEKLKILSSAEKRSINNLIELIIQKYLDEYEGINGAILPHRGE